MNFQQLRAAREIARGNLNLTEAAGRLATSQPGVSKQVRELEQELGIPIFVRRGKRFVGLTDPGRKVIDAIDRVLLEVDDLRRIARQFGAAGEGELRIATTHTQARYALPEVVTEFKQQYPKVQLSLHQGNPSQVAALVLRGEADIGIATEALDDYPRLAAMPAYTWSHTVVARPDHPIVRAAAITLETLARYPIVTYDVAFTGRTHIDAAFAARGLAPEVVIAAIDADVIKTYVELGLGIGIIASMAYDPERDRGLRAIDARHLFPMNTTRIAIRRGAFLADFVFDFIERFAPPLTRGLVERVLAGDAENYEL